MTLVPVEGKRGVWRDTEYPIGTPGVHALIAGVSDYPYLAGGSRPAPNPMGMGQLVVSASSAAQIFGWLRKTKRLASRRVMTCRLLLAPGPSIGRDGITEQAFVDGITGGHHEDPTFDGLERAIKGWADEFYIVPRNRSAENAAFFFFSGHGFEVFASPSLLARDILNPTSAQGANNAVAYKGFINALPTYGLGAAVFLFDACRNELDLAQKLNIVGQKILKPVPLHGEGPQCMMWLKATKLGARAYQDPKGPRRATLFGQAVIEALEGIPPDYHPYDVTQTPWRLLFQGLESYTTNRVRVLLAAQDAMKEQPVEQGGDPYNAHTLIAEREPDVPPFDPDRKPPTKLSASEPQNDTMAVKDATFPVAVSESNAQIADIIAQRSAEVLNRFDITFSRADDYIDINTENDTERFGMEIVRRALEAPLRQIAENAGENGSVIAGKVFESEEYAWGFDAETGDFKNLIGAGIIDPTKVVRTALQDAASVAGLLITTETMIAEQPEKKKSSESPVGSLGGMGGMDF
jgi:hypothetical protein